MSFFSGIRADNIPGPIMGNPLKGLCEKVCIQVNKVFDACMKQEHLVDTQITLTSFTPANPTYPLSFVSGQTSTTVPVTLTNVRVTRFEDRPSFARISATANIPVDIVYNDANNVQGVATGVISLTQDVVLFVPQPSIIPFVIEPVASVIVANATFDEATSIATIEGCVLLIIKVVAEVELLVPSYGYCFIPQCQDFSTNVCDGFFEMPLFPTLLNTNTNDTL